MKFIKYNPLYPNTFLSLYPMEITAFVEKKVLSLEKEMFVQTDFIIRKLIRCSLVSWVFKVRYVTIPKVSYTCGAK